MCSSPLDTCFLYLVTCCFTCNAAQVASRVALQAATAQGALLGQAGPQMVLRYMPQQQLPVLDVSFSTTLMLLLIGKSAAATKVL